MPVRAPGRALGSRKRAGRSQKCLKGVPEAHRPLCAADGKPYRRGQTVYHVDDGDRRTVNGTVGEYVILDGCKKFPLDYTHERPVRGADGVPIKVGDTLYDPRGREIIVEDLDGGCAVCVEIDECTHVPRRSRWGCDSLTHFKPVLDADGVPYEPEEDVYSVRDGREFHVSSIDHWNNRIANDAGFAIDSWENPEDFTHAKPVLDADGVPIKVGDTVWFITDKYADDKTREFSVRSIAQEKIEVGNCQAYHTWTYGQHLTHIKPEPPDSWERIEQDAKNIWGKPIPFGKDAESTFTCRVVDLVRRCKALAAEKHGGYDLRRMYDDFTSYLECCDEPDWTFYNEIIGAIERYWQNGGE